MSNPAPVPQRFRASQIHNENCWAYLQKINLSDTLLRWLKDIVGDTVTHSLESIQGDYNPTIDYAACYTELLHGIEDHLADLPAYGLNQQEQQNFILSLYDNDNHILERTFDKIKDIPTNATPRDHRTAKKISHQIRDTSKHRIHRKTQSPSDIGSPIGRLASIMSDDFKPQHTTGLATIRHYNYRRDAAIQEYRFGTQGQRHQGQVRVSPLFEAWLSAHKAAYRADDNTITHVYINNLARDRDENVLELHAGKKESDLTTALEKLEERHTNVAVITLPADKGLMQASAFKKTIRSLPYQDCFDTFLNIAMERHIANGPTDFYISTNIRRKLFDGQDDVKLRKLIEESFSELHIQSGSLLSPAEQQAVWVYFIKFKLTDYILVNLSPKSVNFTCKDAIDRGGVSSVYYHVMKSIQSGTPITREEFERAIHAAPTLVKARGMNHQINVLWNAIDVYLRHPDNNTPDWLYEWRDMNCPHPRVDDLLQHRAETLYSQLDEKSQQNPDDLLLANALADAKKIIGLTKNLHAKGVSSKRLFLEVIVRTNMLITAPSDTHNREQYKELIKKITIKYPMLQLLAGAMKMLIGACLGQHHLKAQGKATALAALNVGERKTIQGYMRKINQHTFFSDTPIPQNSPDSPPLTPQKK